MVNFFEELTAELLAISTSFMKIANKLKKLEKGNAPLIQTPQQNEGNNKGIVIKFKNILNNNCSLNLGVKKYERKEKPLEETLNINIKRFKPTKRNDNRWMARYKIEDEKLKCVYGKTEHEVVEKMENTIKEYLQAKIVSQQNASSKTILNDWFAIYIRKYKDIKKSSLRIYQNAYKTSIENSLLGKKEIGKITVEDIQTFFESLETYNRKKISKMLLKELFLKALNCGYIAKNVVEIAEIKLKKPIASATEEEIIKNLGKEKKALEPQEIQKLFDYLEKNGETMLLNACKISLYTGMRKGEILGLKWKDIDFESKTICVVRAFNSTTSTIEKPKTVSSIRKIILPKKLEELFLEMKKGKNDEDYIFNLSHSVSAILTIKIKKIMEKNNIKGTFHSFRHTFASILRERGVDDKMAQELLGHENLSTTQNVYQELMGNGIEKQKELIDSIEFEKN